jgi:8-oxo-dGTP pyrophosphatase MutT (NUDIX family)
MTLHADAVRTLTAWNPSAELPEQRRLRAEYLEYLDDHPDGVWRSNRPAHITASALVVDQEARRVLLTLHPKVGRWLQLGGHCEPEDVSLGGAALREATEESGIEGLLIDAEPAKLDLHQVHCAGREQPPSRHLDVQYLAMAPAGAEPLISDESLDLKWFPWDAPPEPTDDSVRVLVAQARRRFGS